MRIIVLLLILFLSSFSLQAQDIIILRTGEEIEAKVVAVNPENIEYKKFSNLEGPTYTLQKWEIFKISYAAGNEEVYMDFRKPAEEVKPEIRPETRPSYLPPEKKKPENFKQKGFTSINTIVLGPEFYEEYYWTSSGPRLGLQSINGYQFSKKFSAGLGIGIVMNPWREIRLPVYGALRFDLSDKRFRLFMLGNGGIEISTDGYLGGLAEAGIGGKYYLSEKTALVISLSGLFSGVSSTKAGVLSVGFAF